MKTETEQLRTYATMAGKSIGKCSSGHWLPLKGNCDLCGTGPDEQCRYTSALASPEVITDYTHEQRMAASQKTLTLAQYRQLTEDVFDGSYYTATITRELEGVGYKINFRRKTSHE